MIQGAGRYRSRFCNDRPALGPADIRINLMNRQNEVGGIRRTCHQFINLSLGVCRNNLLRVLRVLRVSVVDWFS